MIMKYKEQELEIYVDRKYAKPYVQKIKNIIWTRYDSVCEVEDKSFEADDEASLFLYFLCTDDQLLQLVDILQRVFDKKLMFNWK